MDRYNQQEFQRKYAHGYCWAFSLAAYHNLKGVKPYILFDRTEFSLDDIGNGRGVPFHALFQYNGKYYDGYGEDTYVNIAKKNNQYISQKDIVLVADPTGQLTNKYWMFGTKQDQREAWDAFLRLADPKRFPGIL